jgi:hypothetical protein
MYVTGAAKALALTNAASDAKTIRFIEGSLRTLSIISTRIIAARDS